MKQYFKIIKCPRCDTSLAGREIISYCFNLKFKCKKCASSLLDNSLNYERFIFIFILLINISLIMKFFLSKDIAFEAIFFSFLFLVFSFIRLIRDGEKKIIIESLNVKEKSRNSKVLLYLFFPLFIFWGYSRVKNSFGLDHLIVLLVAFFLSFYIYNREKR